MGDLALKVAVLERENDRLRERVAWLEASLSGSPATSYRLFALTLQEERLFTALMARDNLSKDQLLTIAYAERVDVDLPEIKIVDVFVCKIRKKLKPFGIGITTLWGRSYAIEPEAKRAVRALVEAAGRHSETGRAA